jgi:hypothetical protein
VVELSAVNRSVAGSSPACGAIASIAQQVECFHGKEEVTGSSPVGSSIFLRPVGQAVKTPPFHGGNTGSNPVRVTIFKKHVFGGLAQLGEHLPYKQGVGGSIPSSSTIYLLAGLAQLVEQGAYHLGYAASCLDADYYKVNACRGRDNNIDLTSFYFAGLAQLVEQLTCNQ